MKTSAQLICSTLVATALGLVSENASAQCATCATPQVAYSPVVYNNYTYEGWYLGKLLGRVSRRVFGTAPAPAYQVGYAQTYAAGYPATYAAAYPTTYASAYPSAYPTTYAASYAAPVQYPAQYAAASPCTTCGVSPCSCNTCYRPVVMQPVIECATCYTPSCSTCNTCSSGVTQATYETPAVSGCPTCSASTGTQIIRGEAAQPPSLPANTPPQTFRETERAPTPTSLDPIPAEESSLEDSNANSWEAPQLLDPHDRITKRPTAPVWTAVYTQPAKVTQTRAVAKPVSQPAQKATIGWTSGR